MNVHAEPARAAHQEDHTELVVRAEVGVLVVDEGDRQHGPSGENVGDSKAGVGDQGLCAAGVDEELRRPRARAADLDRERELAPEDGDGGCGGGAAAQDRRSMIVTLAWPPPSHIVCNP